MSFLAKPRLHYLPDGGTAGGTGVVVTGGTVDCGGGFVVVVVFGATVVGGSGVIATGVTEVIGATVVGGSAHP